MLNLCDPPSIYDRLVVWVFNEEYKEDNEWLVANCRGMRAVFEFIENNEIMYDIFGMTLAIGNIMNGGTAKGQSDGYELGILAKITSTKDNTNKSMLHWIVQELVRVDAEVPYKFKEQFEVFKTKALDTDSMLKKYLSMNLGYTEAAKSLKNIKESGEEADNYSDKM